MVPHDSCLATAAGLAAAEPSEGLPDAVWTGGSNAEALHLQSPELRPGGNFGHAAEASNMVCSYCAVLVLLTDSAVGMRTRLHAQQAMSWRVLFRALQCC